MKPLYRDRALVLRTTKLGEADMICTLFTAQHGQVRAVAKGLRRTSSKFGARLSPFNCVDVLIREGKNLDTIQQAESIGLYANQIVRDYGGFLAGEVILETAEKLSQEIADIEQFQLLHGAVNALAQGAYPAGMIMSAYLLRALAAGGWAGSWEKCTLCGASQDLERISISHGGAICSSCAVGNIESIRVIHLLAALQNGQWEQVKLASETDRHRVEEITVAFTQWQLEKKLKSLQVLEI